MHLFILIRGHQGAGKSTFAREKIAEFKQQYPQAHIFHIENDIEMTDENGVYHFSSENLAKAQAKGQATLKMACRLGQQQPNTPILIVHSNTNQKSSACLALLHMARKHGFATEIYRLHNFYPNLHHVRESDVLAAYIKLNQNPLRDEIHVPAQQPISAAQQALVQQMMALKQHPLTFDKSQQTFVTAEYLRLGQRDFTMKAARCYPQLRVLKYKRHVFYDNRFDDALLEMRGLILDEHNRIIVRPFKKVFNYSERIAKNSPYPLHIDDEHLVDAVVKVNGFLGCCTYVDLPPSHPSHQAAFNRQTLYSTTGSLDSDFAHMTRTHCQAYEALFQQYPNHTFLFEITDANDVHIIRENLGETLIGVIEVATGRQWSEAELDQVAKEFNAQHTAHITRPAIIKNLTFGALKQHLKEVKHEGFMVFDAHTQEMLFKLKSPYYLVSKFLGRSNENNLERKLNKRHVDEEYYPLIDHIRAHQATFNALTELEKIAFIQQFLQDNI